MIETAEINVGQIIKQQRETLNNQQGSDPAGIIVSLINILEKDIVDYFAKNDIINLNEAFIELYNSVYKLRILTVAYLIHGNNTHVLENEEFINDNIIDVFQRNKLNPHQLNFSIINTMEFYRDNNIGQLFNLLNTSEFNKAHLPSILSLEIKDIVDYRKKNLLGLPEQELKQLAQFEDFFFNSLSLDFSTILYSLFEDKKIELSPLSLNKLAVFTENALAGYKNKYPSYKRKLSEGELAIKIDKYINYTNSFISKEKNNQITPSLVNELNKSISDIIFLKDLEAGWDEEGSTPINFEYIETAVAIACQIFVKFLKVPSFTAPTVNSGVLIEYSNDTSRLDIRIGDKSYPTLNYFRDKKHIFQGEFNQDNLNKIWAQVKK